MENAAPLIPEVPAPVRRGSYRDELNFAEFPLAALTDRIPADQKTLEFTDTIFDHGRRQPVLRKLTITASDRYGLPTALDDEVILGLIQLSHQKNGFDTPQLHFTRYELIKLLGWSGDAKDYRRIEESLNRWMGVTLYYKKAWWSKEEQCWVDESFHILEQVTLLDRERRERRLSVNRSDPCAGKSTVVWNPVVFGSFRSGYLKSLDLGLYKSLKSAIAKRIYRFLDKRFYQKARQEFALQEFASEKIGVSKNYHNGELKRLLRPAIEELERVGFLKPMSDADRFVCQARGQWRVVFVKGTARAEIGPAKPAQPPAELVEKLAARGISRDSAVELCTAYAAKQIEEKIEIFDWLVSRKDKRVSQNPAGFLYASIAKSFEAPADFVLAKKVLRLPLRCRSEEKKAAEEPESPEQKADRERCQAYIQALSDEALGAFEAQALEMTDKFLAAQYRREKEQQGSLFKAVREQILYAHVRRVLTDGRTK